MNNIQYSKYFNAFVIDIWKVDFPIMWNENHQDCALVKNSEILHHGIKATYCISFSYLNFVVKTFGPVTQNNFLNGMGIGVRLQVKYMCKFLLWQVTTGERGSISFMLDEYRDINWGSSKWETTLLLYKPSRCNSTVGQWDTIYEFKFIVKTVASQRSLHIPWISRHTYPSINN